MVFVALAFCLPRNCISINRGLTQRPIRRIESKKVSLEYETEESSCKSTIITWSLLRTSGCLYFCPIIAAGCLAAAYFQKLDVSTSAIIIAPSTDANSVDTLATTQYLLNTTSVAFNPYTQHAPFQHNAVHIAASAHLFHYRLKLAHSDSTNT